MLTPDSPFKFSSAPKKSKPGNLRDSITLNSETKRKINDMKAKMIGVRKTIDDKIDDFSKKKGISKKEILKYLEAPGDLSPEEWDIITNESSQLANQVWDIVNSGTREGYVSKTNRKGKHIGARRKWIPTR